jgi:phosphoglycerate dehydrogenase-like enzyme
MIGPVPSWGAHLLRKHLVADLSFRLVSGIQEDPKFLQDLEDSDVVVAQYFTERMANATKSLKLLHSVGAGVDDFCLPALSPDTTVANVYFHGPAIGEFVMMMVLALSRQLIEVDSQFRRGVWHGSWMGGSVPVEEIQGKVLGVIGFGHIGREVAARARAFDMKVCVLSAHPPLHRPKSIDYLGGPGKLRKLLHDSDYVVVACPLNEMTRGLIGDREFGWMKPSASLINVARAPIIKESALYRALSNHRIRGAAVDVWYHYPSRNKICRPSKFPFHKLSNLIMTPHIAGWTTGTFDRRFRAIARNIERLAAGRPILNVVQGPDRHPAVRSRGNL